MDYLFSEANCDLSEKWTSPIAEWLYDDTTNRQKDAKDCSRFSD